MNSYSVRTVVTDGFEAARKLHRPRFLSQPKELHGHSFRVSAYCDSTEVSAEFPGKELIAAKEQLSDRLIPLKYRDLNLSIEEPSDENLVRWISEGFGSRERRHLSLRADPDNGIDLCTDGSLRRWRKFRFQAAHQLPNVPNGHKCGRMHGHGFEVVIHAKDVGLDAGTESPEDPIASGWLAIYPELDHTCLNEIPGLENPTSELISSWLWMRLSESIPGLEFVCVYETASCGAMFDGSEFRIWKDFSFDSAVRLKRAPASEKKSHLHGHTFDLRLNPCAPLDLVKGWAIDFGDVKTIFDPLFKRLDHHPLHEDESLADCDSRSLAIWIFEQGKDLLPQLVQVDLFEEPGCGASVSESKPLHFLQV